MKQVYYPSLSDTRQNFEEFRHLEGGYGGLFSVTFHNREDGHVFFDALETEKGPSLGTNFTLRYSNHLDMFPEKLTHLSSPFVILAHYNELEWVIIDHCRIKCLSDATKAAEFGAEADLVRVSVGLEETGRLQRVFQHALDVVQANKPDRSPSA